jgi:hypothetical protein
MMRGISVAGALLVASLASGCNLKPEPTPPFEIIINVESDKGHPLPGAVVMKGGKEGPATDATGKVIVKIGGQEGESVDLMIKCPADYVSPTKPIPVLLRRNTGTKLAEYDASCPPAIRHMVVAVRADNGANLPVKVLDRVVGYTDAAGAFTYAVPLRPGDGIEMMLDTSANPLVTPKNPTALLTMKPYDDVVTFDAKLNVAVVKAVVHHVIRPTAIGPRRGMF